MRLSRVELSHRDALHNGLSIVNDAFLGSTKTGHLRSNITDLRLCLSTGLAPARMDSYISYSHADVTAMQMGAMATLIPAFGSIKHRMQAGERRFAERLEALLEDDYLCWFDIPLGSRQRYGDFIILHPSRGLLLLEVKDWKLNTIQDINPSTATIHTMAGIKHVANPLEQARQCLYEVVRRLETDPQLVWQEGPFQGRLRFPFGFGVALTNITRHQFDGTDLPDALPSSRVICSDEMTATVDPEGFQQRLWDMFTVQFQHSLTLPQIDRVRWHLFPEVRITPQAQGSLFGETNDTPDVPDIVRVLDIQQEQLARSLGDGHRVIHGVAGSGKTMILGFRCVQLAEAMSRPILVVCFNVTLAARLREMMGERGVAGQVNVYHFHDWCSDQLRTYHVPRPSPGDDFPRRQVAAVIDAVERRLIPRAQYGAVLIDEGHDFEAEWLKLVTGMVDPDIDSLLLLYDDAQSIYEKSKRREFSLASVGIQARGRTTILRLNYRNTEEVLNFAYQFARRYLDVREADDDGVPLVEPSSAGRHGPTPVVRLFDSYPAEARFIARAIRTFHERDDIPWHDICVTYYAHWMAETLVSACRDHDIPVHALVDQARKKSYHQFDGTVKLMTMHSSKGLEFPVVIVSGIGHLSCDLERRDDEARLLYVALTRSTNRLMVTTDRENKFVEALRQGVSPVQDLDSMQRT